MSVHILLFTQPGCLSCELMRVFLEARQIAFEERDIGANVELRRAMIEKYDTAETPTLVVVSGEGQEEAQEVVTGFDPELLDRLLADAPPADSPPES